MKKTLPYIIITCLVCWAMAFIAYLGGMRASMPGYQLFGMLYMLIPAIVAVLLQKYRNKERIKNPLLISFRFNRWFLIALFTPLVLTVLSIISTCLIVPGVQFSFTGEALISNFSSMMPEEAIREMQSQMSAFPPFLMILLILLSGLLAACTVNALFAFGEELGWRGYMLHHLRSWPYMKLSVFTGVIWGLWHFPLILMGHNYSNHRYFGVFMMVVFCVLLSLIMTYIVIKSKSVITAALFHGSLNAFAGAHVLYLAGGNDLSNGILGYAGFITMGVFILGLFLYDKYITKENIFSSPVSNFL